MKKPLTLSRKAVASAALALALGLGIATSVTAAQAPRHGGEHRMLRGLDRLHDSLKLNADQERLWQKAQGQMKQDAQAARARHDELRDKTRAALDQPNADLHALASDLDRAHDQDIAARRQVRDQWLALYDSLDAAQKEQVRGFLKERMQRADRFRARMHDRREGGQKRRSNASPSASIPGQ